MQTPSSERHSPAQNLRRPQPPRNPAETLRTRFRIVVEPPPDPIPVGDEDMDRDIQIAAPLAHQPRLPSGPSRQISEDRFGVIDGKQGIAHIRLQLAAGLTVGDG